MTDAKLIHKVSEDRWCEILTNEAVEFVRDLVEIFGGRIEKLLQERKIFQEQIDDGVMPSFLDDTKEVRESGWKVAPYPEELADRRIEITGPVDRKMVINALNSGANVFMADFEDSNSPTWKNCMNGQVNLRDAVRRTLAYDDPSGKKYRLKEKTAILFVRPRGLHLIEDKLLQYPVPAALVDFGLFFFHNSKELVNRGGGPYFYLPKLQSHKEAKLWDDVFTWAEKRIEIPHGSTKATVLVEHILAAFQMDEILYALKDHAVGLNCGRWDYIFSYIKTFAKNKEFVVPDRSEVTMDKGFLNAYVELLIMTCHKRGTFAMGGMAAQIPIKGDIDANKSALEQVYRDKLREAKAGHDGTWIAHPGLLEVARTPFDEIMPTPNQIHVTRDDVKVSAHDLLSPPRGTITESGVRLNISVALQYIMNWLDGNGCVAINHLMEDAATAEICRAQLWQWLHHSVTLDNRMKFTKQMFENLVEEESNKIRRQLMSPRRLDQAVNVLMHITLSEDFEEFLTIPVQRLLRENEEE